MDNQIPKNIARGTHNRVADGGGILGEGNSPEDFAHVKRMTPLDLKRKEILADPQYQADAISRERESNTSRRRNDKDVRPL